MVASAGPVASAGSQFALSLVLLRTLPPQEFGTFSFLLVASQFSSSIWSALFSAPLPVLLVRCDAEETSSVLKCICSANLLLSGCAALAFFLIGIALGIPRAAAGLFGLYAAVALIRWFARAYAYAMGMPLQTMSSDLLYSITLMVGLMGAIFLKRSESILVFTYAVLLLSAMAGMIPFGRKYFSMQFGSFSIRAVGKYRSIWTKYSRWSLLGVATTEATANIHVYLVTLFLGARFFAPIAASALVIRPVSVAMNALTEYERPQMAREFATNGVGGALHSVQYFRAILLLAWIISASATILLLIYSPHLLFPRSYNVPTLILGTALWFVVALVRLSRTPDSTLLQACGAFRPLAFASVISAVVSVLTVGASMVAMGAMWSIAGVALGEIVYAFWIWHNSAQLLNNFVDGHKA